MLLKLFVCWFILKISDVLFVNRIIFGLFLNMSGKLFMYIKKRKGFNIEFWGMFIFILDFCELILLIWIFSCLFFRYDFNRWSVVFLIL